MMGGGLILVLCLFCWARYIPAVVSVILGMVVWAVLIWMSITDRPV